MQPSGLKVSIEFPRPSHVDRSVEPCPFSWFLLSLVSSLRTDGTFPYKPDMAFQHAASPSLGRARIANFFSPTGTDGTVPDNSDHCRPGTKRADCPRVDQEITVRVERGQNSRFGKHAQSAVSHPRSVSPANDSAPDRAVVRSIPNVVRTVLSLTR